MKVFAVVLCLAVIHGAIAQRGLLGSFLNAGANSNSRNGNSLLGSINSAVNLGIDTARGTANLATSVGRSGVNMATGIASGVANAKVNALTSLSSAFLPRIASTPINGILNAANRVEQMKLNGLNSAIGGSLNMVDLAAGAGATAAKWGTNAATGALQGTIGGSMQGVISMLTNMFNIPQIMGRIMNNMPFASLRLMSRLSSDGLLDDLRNNMGQIFSVVNGIVNYYRNVVNNMYENLPEIRQFVNTLSNDVSSLLFGGDSGAVSRVITDLETMFPQLERNEESARLVLENVRQRMIQVRDINNDITSEIESAYNYVRSLLSEERFSNLMRELRQDMQLLLSGYAPTVEKMVTEIITDYPELAPYESYIRSGLNAVQRVAMDLSSFLPNLTNIVNDVSQIARYPETTQFANQLSSNLQSAINVPSLPSFNDIMQSAPLAVF